MISDREEKLSELATQQQRLILWRVQYVRLEREWNEVRLELFSFCFFNFFVFRLDQIDDSQFRNEISVKFNIGH